MDVVSAFQRIVLDPQVSDLAAREARANDRWLSYCIDHDKHPDDDAGCQAWQEIFSEEGVL